MGVWQESRVIFFNIKKNQVNEYYFQANCFECFINNLEESLNELEIALRSQREHEFILPKNLTDPTDLSNVIVLKGQGGYNQSKKYNSIRISSIVYTHEASSNSEVSIVFKGITYNLKEGQKINDGTIYKINEDNVLYKKNNIVDTLKVESLF